MKTPAEIYALLPRQLPAELQDHDYPTDVDPRRVRPDGSIKWGSQRVFVGEAFSGEVVGIQALAEGLWHVHLGPLRGGILHERSRTIVPLEGGITHVPGHECHPSSRLHRLRVLGATPATRGLRHGYSGEAETCGSHCPDPLFMLLGNALFLWLDGPSRLVI